MRWDKAQRPIVQAVQIVQYVQVVQRIKLEITKSSATDQGCSRFKVQQAVENPLIPGCSKRSRCEAREKSTSGGVFTDTLERGDRSATKQMGLFQQPANTRPQRIKMEYVLQAANSRTSLSFPHASSGNPGGIRTGPPIKTFGGDDLGESHLFTSAAIFQGGHEVYEERKR